MPIAAGTELRRGKMCGPPMLPLLCSHLRSRSPQFRWLGTFRTSEQFVPQLSTEPSLAEIHREGSPHSGTHALMIPLKSSNTGWKDYFHRVVPQEPQTG